MSSSNKVSFTDEYMERVFRLYENAGSATAIAGELGVPERTARKHVRKAREHMERKKNKTPSVLLPDMPSGDFTVTEILDRGCESFTRKWRNTRAKRWMPLTVPLDGPIGVCWFGDPHVDNPGCNLPLLRRDTELVAGCEGMYGANIGDSTDNWVGRLMKIYAESEMSRKQAWQLVDWFLHDSGIEWLVWLLGNHDEWNFGGDVLRAMNTQRIVMEDWEAQFTLRFPNKREARVWASHNFAGHSMWNTLHGPQKTAHMKDWAHLYVCGHTHTWALHKEESASREFIYWLARTRGYKYIDDHAMKLGHAPQQYGASIISIFNPDATSEARFVQCYEDVEEGCDVLRWKRKRFAEGKTSDAKG